MSRTPQQRIDDALSQLVERILPPVEGEDETAADERYFKALDLTKDSIDNFNAPPVVHDEAHVAELIRSTLLRRRSNPNGSLEFSNLYSRLASRPVLSQKWAILHLLHQLADREGEQRPTISSRAPVAGRPNGRHQAQPSPTQSQQRESRLLDDAFARPGLSTLPSPRAAENLRNHASRPSPRTEPPPRKRRDLSNNDATHRPASHADPISNQYSPSEASLLRDLPFTLQGVSSTNLAFTSDDMLSIPPSLPTPIVSLLHALAEPSMLYKRLAAYVDSADGGLIAQSLRAAIGIELRSYLGLVATLDGQIRRALAVLDDSTAKNSLGKAGATLKRCVIWTRDATLGLRLMSVIVDESHVKKGGQVISLIHSLASSHGDPFVGAFAERLLSHVTRPFYDMLRFWIYDGELTDPYREFFVSEQSPKPDDTDTASHRGAATSVWEDKYALDTTMIPSIITEEFARKVFLIGKSLNFIRHACTDAAWVEDYSKHASRELSYGDTSALSSSIDEAYRTTMARLIHLMTHKFKLLEHLTALKKYLLLGQGDFIALLMESLASNLDRPANSQYRHTLTAQLEHAIRNSNAQHDNPDVLRRLDARMLELSMGEIGWDVFTLEYKTDAPVDVVVTPHANIQYLKIFNFLWRIKRVEFALGVTWRRCMTGARGILSTVEDEKHDARDNANGSPSLARDWKTTRATTASMIHFTTQLQYYILFHVIESAWSTLISALENPAATLDDLIAAHAKYLRSITRKGLLSSSPSSSSSSTRENDPTSSNPTPNPSTSTAPNFTPQLHELLKTMLAYNSAVEGLYAYSVAEAARSQARQARIESRTRAGRWGVTERDENVDAAAARLRSGEEEEKEAPLPPPLLDTGRSTTTHHTTSTNTQNSNTNNPNNEGPTLPALRSRLTHLSSDFRARVGVLLGDLAHQPDQELRFLGVVMNFNESYRVVGRRERRGARREKDGKGRDKDKDAGGGGGGGGVGAAIGPATAPGRDEKREFDPSSTSASGAAVDGADHEHHGRADKTVEKADILKGDRGGERTKPIGGGGGGGSREERMTMRERDGDERLREKGKERARAAAA